MKYLKQKAKKNLLQFVNKEINNKLNKFLFIHLMNTDKVVEDTKKIIRKFFLSKEKLNSNKTKLQRRCVITNRSRVSSRLFGISRIKLRELLKDDQIPGFTRNVW